MKALIYHGPGEKRWESKSDPSLGQAKDAIVRIDTTTICGTDLHILKGDVPTVTDGRTLGHEAVGTVVETGAAVMSVREGFSLAAQTLRALAGKIEDEELREGFLSARQVRCVLGHTT